MPAAQFAPYAIRSSADTSPGTGSAACTKPSTVLLKNVGKLSASGKKTSAGSPATTRLFCCSVKSATDLLMISDCAPSTL